MGRKITRRDILRLGIGTGIAISLRNDIDYESHIIRQRQADLDKLVQIEPSHHVGRVIYDHHGTSYDRVVYEQSKRSLRDPEFLSYANRYPEDFGINFGLQAQQFQNLQRLLPDSLAFSLFRLFYFLGGTDDSDAKTNIYESDFGKGMKSDIYVFRDAYEKLYLEPIHIKIPLENTVRTLLQHECDHAKGFFEGYDFGNGLVINSSNHYNIAPIVKKFVSESRAYLRGVEYAQQFGRDDPSYWYEVGGLLVNSVRFSKAMENRNFTDFEKRLINRQLDKKDEIRPEIEYVFERLTGLAPKK